MRDGVEGKIRGRRRKRKEEEIWRKVKIHGFGMGRGWRGGRRRQRRQNRVKGREGKEVDARKGALMCERNRGEENSGEMAREKVRMTIFRGRGM